jgi:GMP synthase (glutamine-hydrolysing)
MLNHRLITKFSTPEQFISEAVSFLQKFAANKKVFCALSGGVDSAAVYLLLKHAKINMLPVFIDHGLMRIIRGMEEREYIKKLFPDVMVLDIRKDFLPKIIGQADAEIKRRLFKDGYSDTISRVIAEEKCDLLADGTILPDIEESFGVNITDIKETLSTDEEAALMAQNKKGFVKSQHNLDIKYQVEATVQPVASLTKPEIRKILEYFKMPLELVYRKAFPGPALAARIIGPVSIENLAFEKTVHDIIETAIDDHYIKSKGKPMIVNQNGEQEPFQAFAAIGDDVLKSKVTGLLQGKRTYEYPIALKGEYDLKKLVQISSNLSGYARLFYELGSKKDGKFDVVIRSINSKDARTASVTDLPFPLLQQMKEKILALGETKTVFLDVTPKPPGTIEYV